VLKVFDTLVRLLTNGASVPKDGSMVEVREGRVDKCLEAVVLLSCATRTLSSAQNTVWGLSATRCVCSVLGDGIPKTSCCISVWMQR
jgi:hypothetical protein